MPPTAITDVSLYQDKTPDEEPTASPSNGSMNGCAAMSKPTPGGCLTVAEELNA